MCSFTHCLQSQFDDKLNPMEFRFSFGLSTDNNQPSEYPDSATQDVNRFPVLDTEGSEEEKSNAVTVAVRMFGFFSEKNILKF